MKNFIDEAIKILQELKEQDGIIENVTITYGSNRLPIGNGQFKNVPDGNFCIEINGSDSNKKASN